MFDLISDIHLDFWVNAHRKNIKWEQKIHDLIIQLLPTNPSDTLVIAGDLGHYNEQNKLFLQLMKNHYKYILLVWGNHDYYLVSNNVKEKYYRNSMNRIIEMRKFCNELENVWVLEGECMKVNGIYFGGTGMWYDYSVGMKLGNQTEEDMNRHWFNTMNDSRLIHGMPNTLEWFREEKQKLDSIIEDSDVIVTHVGPLWEHAIKKQGNPIVSGFYSFDGKEYIHDFGEKIWCFGHAHLPYDQQHGSIRMVNQALGYPDELKEIRKIKTIK